MAARLDLWTDEQVKRAVGAEGTPEALLKQLHEMCLAQGLFVADLVPKRTTSSNNIKNKKQKRTHCPYCNGEPDSDDVDDHMRQAHPDILSQLENLRKIVSDYTPPLGNISTEPWGVAATLFAYPFIETIDSNEQIREHHTQLQDGLTQVLGGETYITSLQSMPSQSNELRVTHVANCDINELFKAVKSLPFSGEVTMSDDKLSVQVKKGTQKSGKRRTLTWESSNRVKEIRGQLGNMNCDLLKSPNSRTVRAEFPNQQAAVKCYLKMPGAVFTDGVPSAFASPVTISIDASDITLSELLRRYLSKPAHMIAAIACVAWAMKTDLFRSCSLTPSTLFIMYIYSQLGKNNINFINPSSIALSSCKKFPAHVPQSLAKQVDKRVIKDAGNYVISFFQTFISEEKLSNVISISRPYQETVSKAKGLHVEDPFTMELLSRGVNEVCKLRALSLFRDAYRQLQLADVPHGGLFTEAKCKLCDNSLPPLSPVSYHKTSPNLLCLLCTKEGNEGIRAQSVEKLSQVLSLLETWSQPPPPMKSHMKEIKPKDAVRVKTKSNGR
eukprot:TRINITY_DN7858_c2_g1_i1.p1 TRINITY_DN7858_c2_g1~~TRINITY_DN7858_c2_g1_i1.p1  ORF type:complete len:555 (+),score=96.29 TRINITY_DN7858_c2_g1_i1:194-1858(+)